MISLETAIKLKRAGLKWEPASLDSFAIPDRDLEGRVFVISNMHATLETIQGSQVIAFQGASEWALDDILTEEVVWLPSEEQLRGLVEAALLKSGRPELNLLSTLKGVRCSIKYQGEKKVFDAKNASEAYAAALLYLLQESKSTET